MININKKCSFYPLAILTLLLVAGCTACLAVVWIFACAPQEASMGIVQKIFYFHVSSAYAMYLGAIVCFVGSVVYLKTAHKKADALAWAGAQVAVVFGAMVMVSGPLWALKAWGALWTWDPRLTTSLLTVLIYLGYVVLRANSEDHEFTRRFAAALGVLGAMNLPLIHLSVRYWSGQHPQVISVAGGGLQDIHMKIALGLSLVAFTLLSIILLYLRTKFIITHRRLLQLQILTAAMNEAEEADADVGSIK